MIILNATSSTSGRNQCPVCWQYYRLDMGHVCPQLKSFELTEDTIRKIVREELERAKDKP